MNGFGLVLGSRQRHRQPNAFTGLPAGSTIPSPMDGSQAQADRRTRDIADNFYPTPPEATRALLSVETFDGPVHEPACGEGHIAEELKAAGYGVVATDLNDRGYGTSGLDFLSQQVPLARHIVTNPPYGSGLADAFVRKALLLTQQTGGKVAMLLNLASLAEPTRTPLWRRHPPARLYAIDGVVCWPEPVRRPPAHFTRQRYCWAVWTPDHKGFPAFWWLSAAEFRTPQSFPNTHNKRR
jgi:hypothetical protein